MEPLRHRLFLLAVTTLSFDVLSGQSIITGEHGTNDHFVDPDPDMHIYSGQFSGDGIWAVDMDGDTITDITFYCFFDGGNNANSQSTTVGCATHAAIARGDQPCGQNTAFAFADGQTIDGSLSWTSGYAGLSYRDWYQGQTLAEYNCFQSAGYLGVRLESGQDLLYGWVRLIATTSPSITVYEFACSTAASGIGAVTAITDRFYYDHARDELSITMVAPPSDPWSVDLYDASGRHVLQRGAANGTHQMSVGLHTLSDGAYTFATRSLDHILLKGRFVIAR